MRPATLVLAGLASLAVSFVPVANGGDEKQATRIGEPTPGFDLPVVQGKGSGKLDAHRGRVVVLKFWATYCGWCKSIRPSLVEFADAHPDTVSLLGISSQGTKKLLRYLKNNDLGFPILHDKGRRVARTLKASSTPTLLVIDQCGVLRFHSSGTSAAKKAMALAEKLIEASADPESALAQCGPSD
jgi:peroxiredoxin